VKSRSKTFIEQTSTNNVSWCIHYIVLCHC